MNVRQQRIVLIAAVCVVGISLAAATLDSPEKVTPGGGESGADDIRSTTPGGGSGTGAFGPVGPSCVSWLATPWAALGLLAVLGGGTVLVHRRYSRFEAVSFAGGVAVPLLGLYSLVTACRTVEARRWILERFSRLAEAVPVGSPGGTPGPAVSTALLALALLGGILIAVVFLHLALSDRGRGSPGDREDDDGEDAPGGDPIDDARGHLAEDGDPASEIHRAWLDMASRLDVSNPDARTPGEFAAAAIEAGFDREPVRDLTRSFERVRYGGFEATAEREAAARRALRRIDASHEDAPVFTGEGREGDSADE